MTVKEFIEALKRHPIDMQVRIVGCRNLDTAEIVLREETRFGGALDVLFITGE